VDYTRIQTIKKIQNMIEFKQNFESTRNKNRKENRNGKGEKNLPGPYLAEQPTRSPAASAQTPAQQQPIPLR
jgi:hypothetical protein